MQDAGDRWGRREPTLSHETPNSSVAQTSVSPVHDGTTAPAESAGQSSVPALSPDLSPNSPPDAGSPQDAIDLTPAQQPSNYIVRHWKGLLTLSTSFWINGFSVNFLLGTFFRISQRDAGSDLDEWGQLGYLTTYVVIWCTVLCWQVVGIWRSADRHREVTRRAFWATFAQVVLVFGTFQSLAAIGTTVIPTVTRTINALQEARGYKYEFHSLSETEAVIQGKIGISIASDFWSFLRTHPNLKVVHLDSEGGLVSEGKLLAGLISKYRLSTYVENRCFSSCTFVFLAGYRRFIAPGALVGFHQSYTRGMPESDAEIVRTRDLKYLVGKGVPTAFAERAVSTSPSDMWLPSTKQLLEAQIATDVAFPGQFKKSSQGDQNLTKRVESEILDSPVFAALKKKRPEAYRKLVALAEERYAGGHNLKEVRDAVTSVLLTVLAADLPYAPDELLVKYAKFLMKELGQLERASPQHCVDYIFGDHAGGNYVLYLDQATVEEEFRLLGEIISASNYDNPFPVPAQRDLAPSWDRIRKLMEFKYGLNPTLLAKTQTAAGRKALGPEVSCKVIKAYYNSVLELPAGESVKVLRLVWANNTR